MSSLSCFAGDLWVPLRVFGVGLPAGVGLFMGDTCFFGVCFFGVRALSVSFLGVDMSLMESASLMDSFMTSSDVVLAGVIASCNGVATFETWASCGVVGSGTMLASAAMFFLEDDVFGVVDLADLVDLGVTAFGVVDLGVAAFGVVDFGVTSLGLSGFGVDSFGVGAREGLMDLRCRLEGICGASGSGAYSACLTGDARICFSTVGDGSTSCS